MNDYFSKNLDVINFKQVDYTPAGTPTNDWYSLPFYTYGSISYSGCTLVSSGMALNYMGVMNDSNTYRVTPKDVHIKGHYDVNQYSVGGAGSLYKKQYTSSSGNNFEGLKATLFSWFYNQNRPVMAYSEDSNTGASHSVVVRGFSGTLPVVYDALGNPQPDTRYATASMFLINDPATMNDSIITLQDMITRYRNKGNAAFDLKKIGYYY